MSFNEFDSAAKDELEKFLADGVPEVQTAETLTEVHVSTETFSGSDIGAAFNNARSKFGTTGVRYTFENGDHDLTTALDLTGITGIDAYVELDLRGTVLTEKDTIGMDLTGSHDSITVRGGRLRADPNSDVDVGVLLARDDSSSSGNHRFYGTEVVGRYDIAPMYNVSSEVNDFYGCKFSNIEAGAFGPAGSRGVQISGDNPDGVSSPYASIDGAVNATTQDNRFFGGQIDGDIAVQLRSAAINVVRDVHLKSVIMGASTAGVRWDLANSGVDRFVMEDCRISDQVPTEAFGFISANAGRVAEGFKLVGGVVDSGTTDIAFGTSSDGINLIEPTILNVNWLQGNGINVGDLRGGDIRDPRGGQSISINGTMSGSRLWWETETAFSVNTAVRSEATFVDDSSIVKWDLRDDNR